MPMQPPEPPLAARTWPGATVTMVDVNERACALADENLRINRVDNVEILCGDAVEVLGERSFDTKQGLGRHRNGAQRSVSHAHCAAAVRRLPRQVHVHGRKRH